MTTAINNPTAPPSYETLLSQEPLEVDVKDLSMLEKKELLETDSVISTETSVPLAFTPNRVLQVGAKGVKLIRFPLPPNQLEVPITTTDGSLMYVSLRQKACSGNATLVDAVGHELAQSKYRFGPGKPPKISLLAEPEGKNEIVVSSRWTSRTVEFIQASVPVTFQWKYLHEKNDQGKKITNLTLIVPGKEKKDGTRIAQLVRNEATRTPGSGSSDAGNGGELQIDLLAAKGLGIAEDVVVSTLLLMLKKEIDRRRAVQFMIIAGVV
jgi:hypothetical protein